MFYGQFLTVTLSQVLRDRVHQAPSYRGLQAPGGDSRGGEQDRAVQAGVSLHLRLGDQGPPA